MAHIKTSKGFLEYKTHLLYFGNKVMDKEVMHDNIRVLSLYLDKIDINWGPAFGTLIGIVRNGDFQSWKPVFDIYILKEDEERFKDILWLLMDVGYKLMRYERRGLYILERKGEYINFLYCIRLVAMCAIPEVPTLSMINTCKIQSNGILRAFC